MVKCQTSQNVLLRYPKIGSNHTSTDEFDFITENIVRGFAGHLDNQGTLRIEVQPLQEGPRLGNIFSDEEIAKEYKLQIN